ncbi:MAG TPA: DUF4870 domain-containing protein [Oscillatoriaceae cyanobacterium]
MSQATERAIGPAPSRLSMLERLASAAAHGTFLIVGIPLIAPLAVLMILKATGRATPYVRAQALQATLFQALLFILAGPLIAYFIFAMNGQLVATDSPIQMAEAFAGAPGPMLVLLIGLLIVLAGSFFEFVAAAQALRGQPYNLPLVGRWSRS